LDGAKKAEPSGGADAGQPFRPLHIPHSGVRTKFFHNRKMNQQKTVKKVCSDPALDYALHLDAAMSLLIHFQRQERGASEFFRWTIRL
jgi:hypothetical protein